MRIANIPRQITAVAGASLATAFLLATPISSAATQTPHAAAPRALHAFVSSSGFRIEGVFIDTESKMIDLMKAWQPAELTLHACRPQDRSAADSLAALLNRELAVKLNVDEAKVKAIECSYPTEKERGARAI